ncbi:MAG TPA: hydroxymethylglutaryl-CoA lyase [Sphingobacteriaceae bacterium]|nr:hydroxymethylglutaryl-CoA lyase [Sphingobacteriaceae bacterium]
MKLIECPRDAMQGLQNFIPTSAKVQYLNLLLDVGFDTLDFGSFVSHRAIPQMKDTSEVLDKLDLSTTKTKLLAIAANMRGAEEAVVREKITYIGFPFSISETFQQRNTNSGIVESLDTVEKLQTLCEKNNKKAVIYISMAFGNPYGDEWNAEIVSQWITELAQKGCTIISLADTVGLSTSEKINNIVPVLIRQFPDIEFGVHLHSTAESWYEKVNGAYMSGCKRFDSALKGYGGCPMATDELVGNIATENIISYLQGKDVELTLDWDKWQEALEYSNRIFVA